MRLISKYKTEGRLIPKAQYGVKVPDTVLNYWRKQGLVLPPSRNEQVSADNRTKELKEAQERDTNTRQLGNTIKQFGIDTRNQLGTILSYVNPSFGLALGLGDAGISTLNGNYIEGGIQAGLEALPFIGKTVNKAAKLVSRGNSNIMKSLSLSNEYKRLIKENEVPIAKLAARNETNDFFRSPVVKEANESNRKIYERINKVDRFGEGVAEQRVDLFNRPLEGPEIVHNSNTTTAAEIARTTGKNDRLRVNLGNPQSFEDVVRGIGHEYRHHGYYGEGPLEHPNKQYLDSFYKWKASKLLKNKNGIPKTWYDYLFTKGVNEVATNSIDLGKDLGLSLGQPYPGKIKVLDMLNSYNGRYRFMRDALDLSTTPHVKRAWDALTGKYFAAPAIGITSINQLNNNE